MIQFIDNTRALAHAHAHTHTQQSVTLIATHSPKQRPQVQAHGGVLILKVDVVCRCCACLDVDSYRTGLGGFSVRKKINKSKTRGKANLCATCSTPGKPGVIRPSSPCSVCLQTFHFQAVAGTVLHIWTWYRFDVFLFAFFWYMPGTSNIN